MRGLYSGTDRAGDVMSLGPYPPHLSNRGLMDMHRNALDLFRAGAEADQEEGAATAPEHPGPKATGMIGLQDRTWSPRRGTLRPCEVHELHPIHQTRCADGRGGSQPLSKPPPTGHSWLQVSRTPAPVCAASLPQSSNVSPARGWGVSSLLTRKSLAL